METKLCIQCNIDKPLDEFYWKNKSRGYRDSKCKKCRYEILKRNERRPVMNGKKQCGACKEWLPVEKFAKASRNKDGREYFCSKCRWDRKDKKRAAIANRASYLWCKYNLTLDDYQKLSDSQDRKCYICGDKPKYNLCVDHCHDTNTVRGLLCNRCNRTIGAMEENVELIRRMVNYLDNPPAKAVLDEV